MSPPQTLPPDNSVHGKEIGTSAADHTSYSCSCS